MIFDTDILYAIADVLADCGGVLISAKAAEELNNAAAEIDKLQSRVTVLETGLKAVIWKSNEDRTHKQLAHLIRGIRELAQAALSAPAEGNES